jgi:hypothetical protein
MVVSNLSRFLILAAATLSIVACAKNEDEKDKNSDDSVVIAGDRSACNYLPGEVLSPIIGDGSRLAGPWQAMDRRETNTIRRIRTLDIKTVGGSSSSLEIRVSTTCELKSQNRGIMVGVVSPGVDQIGSLNIQLDQVEEANQVIGGTQINCEASLSRGTYQYEFKEKCLVLAGEYYVRRK